MSQAWHLHFTFISGSSSCSWQTKQAYCKRRYRTVQLNYSRGMEQMKHKEQCIYCLCDALAQWL